MELHYVSTNVRVNADRGFIPMKHVILEPQAKNLKRRPRPFASLEVDRAGRWFILYKVQVATSMDDFERSWALGHLAPVSRATVS